MVTSDRCYYLRLLAADDPAATVTSHSPLSPPHGDHAGLLALIGGAAAIAIGAAFYAIDQDPGHADSHGNVTKYYLDTAPFGVALSGAGLTSVGVGVWRWRHKAHASLAPTVSISSSRTIFSWTGQF